MVPELWKFPTPALKCPLLWLVVVVATQIYMATMRKGAGLGPGQYNAMRGVSAVHTVSLRSIQTRATLLDTLLRPLTSLGMVTALQHLLDLPSSSAC